MKKKIKILKNGPFEVSGNIPLYREKIVSNENEESIVWEKDNPFEQQSDTYHLCRCGHSKSEPFCDGEHALIDFDGTELAGKETYREKAWLIEGKLFDLLDQKDLCIGIRFCVPEGGTKELVRNSTDEKSIEIAKEQTFNCTSGRFTLMDKNCELLEPSLEKEISVLEDPLRDAYGPLWVKGGIEIVSSNGESYEVRNRVTLCRCGESKNMPFCDASHYKCPHMQKSEI